MQSPLGFFINVIPRKGELDKIASSGVALVKTNDSQVSLDYLSPRMPNTTFIARAGSASADIESFGVLEDPEGSARRWLDSMRPIMDRARYAYWESYNEVFWEHIPAYNIFEATRINLMAAEGYRACTGNFSVGTPDIGAPRNDWAKFMDALRAAAAHNAILGLHEYGSLWMDMAHGNNQTDFVLGGNHDAFTRDYHKTNWLFGRYRQVNEKVLKPNNLRIRIALTEGGLDRCFWEVADQVAGGTVGPFRWMGDIWKRLDHRTDRDHYYVEQLLWAKRQMMYDADYMIGMAIFVWGPPNSDWDAWDIEGQVADELIADAQATLNYRGVRTTSTAGQYIRMQPGMRNRAVGLMQFGTVYPVLGAKEGWFYILKNNVAGWVDGRYIEWA